MHGRAPRHTTYFHPTANQSSDNRRAEAELAGTVFQISALLFEISEGVAAAEHVGVPGPVVRSAHFHRSVPLA